MVHTIKVVNKLLGKAQGSKRLTLGFLFRVCFARYYVYDNYGTRELCYSLEEAKEWLKVCGTVAVIGCRLRKKVVASRCYTASFASF